MNTLERLYVGSRLAASGMLLRVLLAAFIMLLGPAALLALVVV